MNTPIDVSNVILKTERMILRPWRQSDLEDFFEYASVDGVGQMAGWKPHENIEISQFIMNRFIENKKTFALEYQGKVIGSLGIELYNEKHFPELDDKKCREIGYVLSKDYWGQGLMPEAVREVIRYLFEEVGLDVILCGHFLRNTQSARVQEKCGFRHYAYGIYQTQLGITEEDETNMITREQWLEDQKKVYRFYGWEKADIRDERDLTPRDYYDILSEIWCPETCAPRMRDDWSKENKTLGQCSITAFLMQDIYGGKVYGVPLEDGNYHCFNVVGNCVFDLTSEQFGDVVLDYFDCPEQFREIHFANEEKRQRYELLKSRLFERLEKIDDN